MIDAVRLSRATYQLAERGIEALERIAHELERYNDLQAEAHERNTEDR
ncbi:hypothetical protein [Candidatus Halobonum tyrrellensis]|uniref:Uncharacterized protein n=1 Tax=Candidatus Halobonum tyrrellensis G22 TaxID=1324957 RepID=V4HGD2_9EURY|nr:hypothetical protein [Candidatus Halobonum tyrrellensis]ESP86849.1 hypothetical protein K933_17237 [Candidatus Halobonum tyrrellensis G22]